MSHEMTTDLKRIREKASDRLKIATKLECHDIAKENEEVILLCDVIKEMEDALVFIKDMNQGLAEREYKFHAKDVAATALAISNKMIKEIKWLQ